MPALLSAGCALSHPKDTGGGPDRAIAARPESLAPTAPGGPAASASASASGSRGPGASASASTGTGSSRAPGSNAPSASASPGAPPPPFHMVGTATDASGDAGATTPGYGDIVSVTVEDNGPSARITVFMRSTIPARLPSNETMGVGVDFFKSVGEIESDYQVFADGEPDGWFAYFTGPKGRVKFPGTFGLGGNRMQFTVPWSAFGSPAAGYFSGFADWTRTVSPANLSGEDHAPDLTTQRYQR